MAIAPGAAEHALTFKGVGDAAGGAIPPARWAVLLGSQEPTRVTPHADGA